MARRPSLTLLLVLCVGSLACGALYLAYAGVLVVRAFATMIEQVSADFLVELARYVYVVAILEVVVSALILMTRGPVMALAWISARVAAWQGR